METGEFGLFTEPIFEGVNRSALLLVPKEVYRNWGMCVMEEKRVAFVFEPEMFLTPLFSNVEEAELFLMKFFDLFFQHELRKWGVDSSFWPLNRTWEMFNAWFEIRLSCKVADIVLISGWHRKEEVPHLKKVYPLESS